MQQILRIVTILLDGILVFYCCVNKNSFSSDNDGSESSGSKSGSRHRHRLLRHGLTLSEAETKSQKQGEKKKKSKREVQDLGCVVGELNVRCTVAQVFFFLLLKIM